MVTVALDKPGRRAQSFSVWVAAILALVAGGAFFPTYWLQLGRGTFIGAPLIHLHAALFYAWLMFFLSQAILASTGRLSHHRAWGLVGISLATAMVVIGLASGINSLNVGLAAGYGDRSRAFFSVPFTAIGLFAGLFIAAIVNIRDPEAHKRYMLLATSSLVAAGFGRIAFILATGGGPGLRPGLGMPAPLLLTAGPALVPELIIIAGIIHDWKTQGRIHRAWWIGAAAMTAVPLLRIPLGSTNAWYAFADFMAGFGR